VGGFRQLNHESSDGLCLHLMIASVVQDCHRRSPVFTFAWRLKTFNASPFNLYRWQTGFSGFRRHLLEQSSTTRDICTVARDIQTAPLDISLPFVISGHLSG